ncbi:MAG: type I restriction endonuclease [Devosia sp.]
MTFKDDVADLAKRAIRAQAVAQTEEATKNAIVMPFLRVLGFDVFDPTQVIPEYIADVGLKKGEKIDYAVKIGDRIEYLVEAKSVSTNLRDAQYSQLFRYFHTCDANIGILTNGLHIWFYSDLEAPTRWTPTRSSSSTCWTTTTMISRSWRSSTRTASASRTSRPPRRL